MKLLVFILPVFSIIISSCNQAIEDKATQGQSKDLSTNEVTLTDEQVKTLDITLGRVEKRVLNNIIKVNGMLDVPPQNLVTISAPLGGFVKHTELLQGMKVKKGQVLAIMEHVDYIQLQQDYLDSKNQLEYLEIEYKRQQELASENVNSAKTFQLTKSNYLSMKAKTEGLRAKLKLINISPTEIENGEIRNTISIIAPITGFVTQVNVNIGAYVNPTDAMFKLVDTDHLHAEAQVFEKDLAKLKIGQRVLITLSNEVTPRLAKVYLIGKEISNERTVRVHCHLEKEDPGLLPGMYFNAIIEVGDKTVNAMPENAIVSFEGKDYIFTSNNKNSFTMVEVNSGVTEAGFTEIVLPEGFDPAISIVTHGTYALLSKIKNAEEE